jgi:glycosyltransferase involved in cell wall biosynthesis
MPDPDGAASILTGTFQQAMRILLAIHNAYTDATSGAAHSMRVLMQWLSEGGHECRVLGSAGFDAKPPDSLDDHLAQLDVPLQRKPPAKTFVRSVKKPANMVVGRPTIDFTLDNVPVTMLLTKAETGSPAERFEAEQFLFLLDSLLQQFAPEVLLTYGGHRVVQEAMRRARTRGANCVFTLHNRGYEDRGFFEHVDYVFTCSPYLSDMYRRTIGLRSTGIEPPINWSDVEAPRDLRKFVTFVNPSVAKGAMLFARLADMLGSRRPDIPMLIVQSATGAGVLNAIPGLDFRKYPHIMVAPATPRPADFFALTRILLVPTAVPESFGRVAAEAMINGIPSLVSDRGALPQTVGEAGRVLPLPSWLTEKTSELPTEAETKPWFEAVCELWDDERVYRQASEVARQVADRCYSEPVLRRRYLDYFASITPGIAAPLFDEPV